MAGDHLTLSSCHRLATSLARAPSLLPLLPPTLLLRLPMVREGEMEGAVLLDSCISALGQLEEELVGELEAGGRAALASLGRVRGAASTGQLVEGLRGVAGTMVAFIQMAASRCEGGLLVYCPPLGSLEGSGLRWGGWSLLGGD